jgi:predicted site-specific integrase-resolvase
MSQLSTPSEIAAIYQVATSTVLRWHRDGIIPASVSVGKVIRFDADEVAKALTARTKRNTKRTTALI